MKILLTAPPGIGKSTVIDRVIAQFAGSKKGIVAREILNAGGERIGFTSVNQAGESRQFMFKTDSPDENTIGGLFNVDIAAIDEFVVPELLADGERGSRDERLVYIDEIGRAQAKSELFLATLRSILQGNFEVLASIVYDDEPWSLEFKRASGVCIIEVTPENRDALPDVLLTAFSHRKAFETLNPAQQKLAYEFLRTLVQANKIDSAKKIFVNALDYVTCKKVTQISCKVAEASGGMASTKLPGMASNTVPSSVPDTATDTASDAAEYEVQGLTRSHKISRGADGQFTCDCDLANGRGDFSGKPALCSHEMSVRLLALE